VKPWIILCALSLLSGCAKPEAVEMAYEPSVSVQNFMLWMLEPASDILWDSAGFIVTEEGEQDLQPTTQQGWDAVRNAATVVAESGNILMMPGYRADDADWVEYAAGLTRAALQARQAAIAKDADALFNAGGALYNVCRACHSKYIIEPGMTQ
jgi:hypothetical protein